MQILCYSRQVHRLEIAITETVRKMDCYELIDKMLSCSGGTAEKQSYEETTGDSLASPDACSGGTAGHEVTGQSRQKPAAPDMVQNYVKGSPRLQRGGGVKEGGMGYLLTEKH